VAAPTGSTWPWMPTPAVLKRSELEIPRLDGADLLGEHRGGIGHVAGMGAVEGEAAHRVVVGELEERRLVEAAGALHRPLDGGDQGQVTEADPADLQGGDTDGHPLGRLPGGDRTGRSVAGHPALMTDPVDRRGRALGDRLIGGRKRGRLAGEAEFEQIDPVAQADQALPERERGDHARRLRHEPLDALQTAAEVHRALAITHPCSVRQSCVWSAQRRCPTREIHSHRPLASDEQLVALPSPVNSPC
jgi:hypothetical protein